MSDARTRTIGNLLGDPMQEFAVGAEVVGVFGTIRVYTGLMRCCTGVWARRTAVAVCGAKPVALSYLP